MFFLWNNKHFFIVFFLYTFVVRFECLHWRKGITTVDWWYMCYLLWILIPLIIFSLCCFWTPLFLWFSSQRQQSDSCIFRSPLLCWCFISVDIVTSLCALHHRCDLGWFVSGFHWFRRPTKSSPVSNVGNADLLCPHGGFMFTYESLINRDAQRWVCLVHPVVRNKKQTPSWWNQWKFNVSVLHDS